MVSVPTYFPSQARAAVSRPDTPSTATSDIALRDAELPLPSSVAASRRSSVAAAQSPQLLAAIDTAARESTPAQLQGVGGDSDTLPLLSQTLDGRGITDERPLLPATPREPVTGGVALTSRQPSSSGASVASLGTPALPGRPRNGSAALYGALSTGVAVATAEDLQRLMVSMDERSAFERESGMRMKKCSLKPHDSLRSPPDLFRLRLTMC